MCIRDRPCTFTNVPRIGEMDATLPMLAQLGTKYEWVDDHTLTLHTPEITGQISEEYSGINRIPILFMGPLLNRIGEAEVPLVGGCTIGPRPVDFHQNGFRDLGADVRQAVGSAAAQDESGFPFHGCHFRARNRLSSKTRHQEQNKARKPEVGISAP